MAEESSEARTPTSLEGVIFVVTGGTDGIGASTALLAAERGATVIISGRSADKGAKVVADIEAKGGKGLFVKTDVTKEEDIKALFAQVVEKYGRVDALFNNAGWEGPNVLIPDYLTDQLRQLYDTNVLGTILSLQEAAKVMKQDEDKTRRKVIVNNSSIGSGLPTLTSHVAGWYVSTKAAIDSVTRIAAGSLQNDDISVYAVNPGAVLTRMAHGAIEMDAMKTIGVDSMDEFKKFNCIGPEKFRMIKPEEIGQVVLHMVAGTTKWKSGDCVFAGPGATTIHMRNLYQFIYAETMEEWMSKVGELKDGYDESKAIPVPL